MDLNWEKKVYDIVLRAQQVPPAQLAQFLQEACDDDPEIQTEVEKRLKGIHITLEALRHLTE